MYLNTNCVYAIKLILFILFMDLQQFYKLSNIFSSRILTFSFLLITEDNHMYHLYKETESFLSVPVGGGHQEDITTSWPTDPWAWPGQLEAPHFLLHAWNVCSAHSSHCRSQFQGCSLEWVRCCWNHLDCTANWTFIFRPLHKLLRYWQVGAEICLSCWCPTQAL